MRTVDKKYFDKYAIDPFGEEFMIDSFDDGWVNDFSLEEPESDELYGDDWDDLVQLLQSIPRPMNRKNLDYFEKLLTQ